MSRVAEIEAAIEPLPIERTREVAAWLDGYQATIYDAESPPGTTESPDSDC